MRDAKRYSEDAPIEVLPMQHPIATYASIVFAIVGLVSLVGWKVAQQAKDVRNAEHAATVHVNIPPPAVASAPPPMSVASTTGAVVAAPAVVASPSPTQPPPPAPRARPHRPAPRAHAAPRASSTSDNPYDAP